MKKLVKLLRMWWTLPGRTLYDPRTNRLFKVHSVESSRAICGSSCQYYGDARRQVSLEPLSLKYVAGCEIVRCVDTNPNLEWDSIVDGWKVKEAR